MSANSRINDSPGHFMVLQAIARGFDTVDKIATAIRKNEDEVRGLVNDLVNQRLANMKEKGRFFRSKETKFTITETGRSLLGVKHQELKESQKKLRQTYDSGNRQQLQSYLDSKRAWIPFMIVDGILDALFFASILSFMGMAISPSEQAAVDNADNADTEGSTSSDTSSDTSDTSGTDSTPDTGGGDVGFDGGGFDF